MRKIIALLIAFTPFSWLRIFFYRLFLGYDISYNSHIGAFNLLVLKSCKLDNARIKSFNIIRINRLEMSPKSYIGKFNRMFSFNSLSVGYNTVIRTRNTFIGTNVEVTDFKERENLLVGAHGGILSNNYFDLTDTLEIGDNVIFGGYGTQIWTHGFDIQRVRIQAPVKFEGNTYVGSGCYVLPGANICKEVSIGAGTTVSKSIKESGFYVSSILIRKGPLQDYSTHPDTIENKYGKFFRK